MCLLAVCVTMQMYDRHLYTSQPLLLGWQNHEIIIIMLCLIHVRVLFSFSCIFKCLWFFSSLFYLLTFFSFGFLLRGKKREFVMRLQLSFGTIVFRSRERRCRKMCECTIALAHAKINREKKKIIISMCFFLSFTHPLTPNCRIVCVFFFGTLKSKLQMKSFVQITIFKVCTPWLLRTSQHNFNCCSIASAFRFISFFLFSSREVFKS